MDLSSLLEQIRVLKVKRKFKDALKLIDEQLADLEPNHKQQWVKLLIEKSTLFLILGDFTAVRKSIQLALHLAKISPIDLNGQAWAFHLLGLVEIWSFSPTNTLDYFTNAIEIFRESNDQRGLAVSESFLGLMYYFQGNFTKAEYFSKEGLHLSNQFGTEDDLTASKIILGIVNVIVGDRQLAESLFQEAVTLSERTGNTCNLAWALYNLGYASFLCNKSGFESTIQQSIAVMEKYETHVTSRLIIARYILICVFITHQNFPQAQAELENFQVLAESSQLPLALGYYHLSHGLVKLALHELGSALDLGLRAKEALISVSYHSGQTNVLKFLLQVHLRLYLSTKKEATKIKINDLLHELEELTNREGIHGAYIEALLLRGILKKADFNFLAAKEQFTLAESLALKCGQRNLIKRVQTELSLLQTQSSNLQRLMTSSPEDFKQIQFQEVLSYLVGAKEQAQDSSR